jgi:DNA-binding transcriptional regulator YiaG
MAGGARDQYRGEEDGTASALTNYPRRIRVDESKHQSINLPLSYRDGAAVRALRLKLGMSQAEFWGQIGVTQSGGSRYENGRSMPSTVAMAIEFAYAPKPAAERLLMALRWDQAA